MSKDFKNFMKHAAAEKPEEISDKPTGVAESIKEEKPKKKVGRPKKKTEKDKVINIAVPESIMDKVEIAKASYDGNLTEYINVLIRKDLQEHFEEYKNTFNVLNRYKSL